MADSSALQLGCQAISMVHHSMQYKEKYEAQSITLGELENCLARSEAKVKRI